MSGSQKNNKTVSKIDADNETLILLKNQLESSKLKAKDKHDRAREVLIQIEKEFENLKSLRLEVAKDAKEMRRLSREVDKFNRKGICPKKQKTVLNKELAAVQAVAKKTNDYVVPSYDSFFLNSLLGKINLRVLNMEDKLNMKNQYHSFKSKTAIVSIILPLLHLVFNFGWAYKLAHQLWIVYLYTSLALREHILCLNGSKIQSWWIYHHYISAVVAFVTITIPPHLQEEGIYYQISKLIVLQGLVMFMQYLYQSKRQYARVATGKAKPFDVALSETLVEAPNRRRILLVLVPMLISCYGCEIYMGASITLFGVLRAGWNIQVLLVGVLLVSMGVGNGFTLFSVLYKKRIK
ncbi:hypothetical protein MHBO_003817, partial [Bonamia ostreae]